MFQFELSLLSISFNTTVALDSLSVAEVKGTSHGCSKLCKKFDCSPSKQAKKHTHMCSAVPLVWGLLRLTSTSLPFPDSLTSCCYSTWGLYFRSRRYLVSNPDLQRGKGSLGLWLESTIFLQSNTTTVTAVYLAVCLCVPTIKGGVYFECGTYFFGKPRGWLAPCTYLWYLATIELDWLDGLLHR